MHRTENEMARTKKMVAALLRPLETQSSGNTDPTPEYVPSGQATAGYRPPLQYQLREHCTASFRDEQNHPGGAKHDGGGGVLDITAVRCGVALISTADCGFC